jgi:hypothetical protein
MRIAITIGYPRTYKSSFRKVFFDEIENEDYYALNINALPLFIDSEREKAIQ